MREGLERNVVDVMDMPRRVLLPTYEFSLYSMRSIETSTIVKDPSYVVTTMNHARANAALYFTSESICAILRYI